MSYQEQFYAQLREKVAPPGENFLMFKIALNWDWAPPAVPGFVDSVEHGLVGTMPKLASEEEEPFYESSGTDIYDAYRIAFSCVKVDEAKRKRKLKKVKEEIKHTSDEQQEEYEKYREEWEATNLPESKKEEWERNTGWDRRLEGYKDQLASLAKQEYSIVHDDYYQALAAIQEEKGFVHMLKDEVCS